MSKKPAGVNGEAVDYTKAFLTVKSDIVFKLFFGDERNKPFLIRFLKAVLDLPIDEYTDLTITDPQTKREYEGDKLSILDVKARTTTGKIIHIEVQVHLHKEMRERIVFYGSKLITDQIGSGEDYDQIKKVYSIIITGEAFINEHDKYHDRFTLYSKETDTELTDIIEYHTLELPKIPKESDGTDLWDWSGFINADSKEALAVLVENSPQMKAPIEKLLELNQDPDARRLFEAREKERRDISALKKGARQEGRQEGERDKALEIARRMLGRKITVDEIMDITGLSAQDIERLKPN